MSSQRENESLTLLTPAPEKKLLGWLSEFYGKPVTIAKRELLRHRDLSYVERLWIADGLPATLIYKLVLPPWDIEQDLHERVLVPSVTNSAQLYMSAHHGDMTAMFLEDLGTGCLKTAPTREIACRVGEDLAKMHRSYCYRVDELSGIGVLRTLSPIDYEDFVSTMSELLSSWGLLSATQKGELMQLARQIALKLAGEPISLVHGDFFAENIIVRNDRFFIIDWSWFTMLGVPLMDLATLTMDHIKNGKFSDFKEDVIEAYCFESGRTTDDVRKLLPYVETLSRILFLHWLVERRDRGIMGTTVGPVDGVIKQVLDELSHRLTLIPA